ncbi:MAG: OmpA family protein, partial [Spirochaetales bacterium]|nr:OmpA family protein [Spirochaetales bacterium]
ALMAAVTLHAEEREWPGTTLLTETSWEGQALPGGFGARAGFAVGGWPRKETVFSLSGDYRWETPDGGEPIPQPGASLSAGWRMPLFGLLRVMPRAGLGAGAVFSPSSAAFVQYAEFGLQASVRLGGRDYFSVEPAVRVPVFSSGGASSPQFSLAFGLRKETPWIMPLRRVQPALSISPERFSPDGDGIDETARIGVSLKRPKNAVRWKASILDAGDAELWTAEGSAAPENGLEWNGTGKNGAEPEPAFDYRCVLETEDLIGRTERTEAFITVDILVIRDGDRYKIRVPAIKFPSYETDFAAGQSRELLEENRATLERIALLFARFPEYTLTVEGHANAVYWADPKRRDREQTETLVPLSRKRAENVREALILLGIEENRIRAVGMGGSRPVVPFGKSDEIWKNRRVEFILSK